MVQKSLLIRLFSVLVVVTIASFTLPSVAFAQINSTLNYYGNQVAMKYYGQPTLTEVGNGAVDAKHALHASGVVVDKSSTPNKMYVVDTGNNRILGVQRHWLLWW